MSKDRSNINWQEIQPDKKYNWLNEGMQDDFETFLSMGSKETKISNIINTETLFKNYGRGVATSRDTWAYNFNQASLEQNIKRTIETYNEQVFKWTHRLDKQTKIDDFVNYDDSKISWSRDLKLDLQRGRTGEFTSERIRKSIYRPFTKSYLYFDRILNEEVYVFPSIFPTPATEENRVMCASGVGAERPFAVLVSKIIPDLNFFGPGTVPQCFPFYTYDEDGTNRTENITDWSLQQYRNHYEDDSITKWDIFHYTYAVLHHPVYRERYAANLKRELPRIPYTPDFHIFAKAGKRLSEIHVNYEQQPEYPLKFIENPDLPLNWQVEKMRFNKDKTAIIYNDFLTLNGIPKEAFQYSLGNRSALEWVIDQYQVTTDKRSGIVNDPNRLDDEEYIVRLIRQVITVSLETVQIVNNLPSLGIAD